MYSFINIFILTCFEGHPWPFKALPFIFPVPCHFVWTAFCSRSASIKFMTAHLFLIMCKSQLCPQGWIKAAQRELKARQQLCDGGWAGWDAERRGRRVLRLQGLHIDLLFCHVLEESAIDRPSFASQWSSIFFVNVWIMSNTTTICFYVWVDARLSVHMQVLFHCIGP